MTRYKKSVLVRGDTYARKAELKKLGGRWNRQLTARVFPGSKRDAVVTALRAVPSTIVAMDTADSPAAAATAAAATAAPTKVSK